MAECLLEIVVRLLPVVFIALHIFDELQVFQNFGLPVRGFFFDKDLPVRVHLMFHMCCSSLLRFR